MATVHDVAAYILARRGSMTAMKLQKLVYYSQAWALVWDDKPLFSEKIEAWANGPVCPALYALHRGEYQIEAWPKGSADALSTEERETVDAVLGAYGDKTSWELSAMTHAETPWRAARSGLDTDERGTTEITHGSMAEFYSNLAQ